MNWKILESVRGLIAVPSSWRKWMREDFEAFNILCLQPAPYIVRSFPCPIECGCWHEVIQNHDGPDSPHAGALGAPASSRLPGQNHGGPHAHYDDKVATGQRSITARCRCDPPTCPDLTLTLADITSVQLNRPKLGRAICKAFLC